MNIYSSNSCGGLKDNIIKNRINQEKLNPTKRLDKVDRATRQNHKYKLDSGNKEDNITNKVTTKISHSKHKLQLFANYKA